MTDQCIEGSRDVDGTVPSGSPITVNHHLLSWLVRASVPHPAHGERLVVECMVEPTSGDVSDSGDSEYRLRFVGTTGSDGGEGTEASLTLVGRWDVVVAEAERSCVHLAAAAWRLADADSNVESLWGSLSGTNTVTDLPLPSGPPPATSNDPDALVERAARLARAQVTRDLAATSGR